MTRLYVAVATVGRADLTARTVDRLADQTRRPDHVLVVGSSPDDVAGVAETRAEPHIVLTRRGLCCQRNCALEMIAGRADILVFFDDDFVPALDYLENIERLFEADPGLVGITGELIDDGIRGRGIEFEEAVVRVGDPAERPRAATRPRWSLYGCNMAIRVSAAEGLQFDEALPLYGWQEDVDFTSRLGRRGRMIATSDCTGIHMGVKRARTPGKKLGYSQIANMVHLLRKGTMRPSLGGRLLAQNLASNAVRSLWPEPYVDRHGRLLGNLIAIKDLVRGTIDPRRIERL